VFIEEYLQELRQQGFTPRALAGYGRSVARRVRENWEANPGAVRSAWSLALAFFAATFIGCATIALTIERGLAYEMFTASSIAILLAFGLVTAGVELLRDPDGYRLSSLNVPLALTLARVVLTPAITLALLDERIGLALGLFLVAGLTDIADGWIARRWRQITVLGTVMDPVVDVVFSYALFAGLMLANLLPTWAFVAATLRYGILVVGGIGLYLFVGPVRIRPTTLGRLMGVITSALVGLLMVLRLRGGHWADRLVPLTGVALGSLLAAGVVHVLALGWYNLRMLRGEMDAKGRVVGDVRWGRQ
jgi:cardiolipin synthase